MATASSKRTESTEMRFGVIAIGVKNFVNIRRMHEVVHAC